jgi:hypothetical protein
MELDSEIKLIPYIKTKRTKRTALFQTYFSPYQTFLAVLQKEENFCIYDR